MGKKVDYLDKTVASSNWKTKDVDGRRMMQCMNSNPSNSKWADFAPEEGNCEMWTEVSNKTTASLCWQCTSRSVNNLKV